MSLDEMARATALALVDTGGADYSIGHGGTCPHFYIQICSGAKVSQCQSSGCHIIFHQAIYSWILGRDWEEIRIREEKGSEKGRQKRRMEIV